MTNLTPNKIVEYLERFIIGQNEAKKAVAIALRNRWRRMQIAEPLRSEIVPKNILMVGPTGVGKTEIARRLAKLAQAPFIKVEATKFTEIGYVGRDVEQIIRDLLEISITQVKEQTKESIKDTADANATNRLLDALVGSGASPETRKKFAKRWKNGELDDKEIEISLQDNTNPNMPTIDIPGMPGAQMGMINLGDIFGKAFSQKTKTRTVKVSQAYDLLLQDENEKLLENDQLIPEAIRAVEERGIVFIDEIDKICARSERQGTDVSREGVQRDLLPLIEGTTVNTKHGTVKTDHILFITSGAFHLAKPSDLLPELQGRLPIRVELRALSQEDFVKILAQTEANLLTQSKAMLQTESVNIDFTDDAVEEIAKSAAQLNQNVENIGARRLHTIVEKLLEDISFTAPEKSGNSITFTKEMVQEIIGELAQNIDLSKFIL